MGVMRFAFDPNLTIGSSSSGIALESLIEKCYLASYDGRVLAQEDCVVENNVLCIKKREDKSAKLFTPITLDSHGELLFGTGSLLDREEPYNLLVELARGKISVIRNQSGAWQIVGMMIPGEFYLDFQDAHDHLVKAIQCQEDLTTSGQHALKALEMAQNSADMLMQGFIEQRIRIQQKRTTAPFKTWVCGIGPELLKEPESTSFCQLFNEARLPISWNAIERDNEEESWDQLDQLVDWCQQQRGDLRAGPLLDFSATGIPNWLADWKDDVTSMQSVTCDFVETAVSKYAGRIRKWEISYCAENGPETEEWNFVTEEVRLKLLIRSIEIIREMDNQLELSLRVSDPWGIYHRQGGYQLAPIQFVDMLTRTKVRFSSLTLELTHLFSPNRTPAFDWLELSRLIDFWGTLGIPIQILLAAPSSQSAVETAKTQPDSKATADFSPASQASWYEKVLPLLVAKETVVGVQFDQFADQDTHQYGAAGFIDLSGSLKESFELVSKFKTFDQFKT